MSTQDIDNKDGEPFVELDPTRRYGRYKDLLGAGAMKKVYRAFDLEYGIEVAWNQVKLRSFDSAPEKLKRLYCEVDILNSLHHPHVLSLRTKWVSSDGATYNFITEICPSGDLRAYRRKHKYVSLKAIKMWAHQILLGLKYLHTHEPCVIHRDLKCSNIFIKGNTGQIMIGDLGLAAIVDRSHVAHSCLGTPEYMAPELFEQDYNELVDIYAFGLCVLELLTVETPYHECTSVAQIYKRVITGVRPEALGRVQEPEVKRFIERCLGKPRDRPSAAELLSDPFFQELNGCNYLVMQPVVPAREDKRQPVDAAA
ncbi:hypothetical protein LUZ62_027821 [Rhynchospora pubera]|uniref:non-specific serine/threonine protein kinase n=1 Tax=Rhynchospora pubera TaxID=906938 RepID=A0AAV8HBM3_9POAL|nr:hypothetical protein LUZ62_027821 [Rhynchospora pubera]